MNIQYKSYNSYIYKHILKHEDLLFFNFYKNSSIKNQNNLIQLSATRNILKISLLNSIFNSIKNIGKIGVIYLKKKSEDLFFNLLNNKNILLVKMYNKIYLMSQLKSLKFLSYSTNMYLFIYNAKYIFYLFLNNFRIKYEKSRI